MPFTVSRNTDTKSHQRQTTLRNRRIVAGFTVLLILLIGNTLFQRRELISQVRDQTWITHTHQVLNELDSLESLLTEAESGQRSFLYTGERIYLEPYETAITQIKPHIDELSRLTADNPRQHARVTALRKLTDANLAELAQTISLYDSNRRAEAKALVLADARQIKMTNFRNLIDQMTSEENSLEASRTISSHQSTGHTFLSIYLSGVIKFVILITMAYLTIRALGQGEKYLGEIWRREEWYKVTLDCIGDAVICTDALGKISLINVAAERLLGYRLSEIEGEPVDKVFRLVNSSTRETITNPMGKAFALNETRHVPDNCVLIRPDGSEIFIEDSVAPIHSRAGEITGAVMVLRDVSLARVLSDKLFHSAHHDSLTGLPNRSLLNDRIERAITLARRRERKLAIMFLDLDGFKHINDSLGHLMGDKLLQSVARRLQDCIRSPDTVSRQGGDEFVVLLQDLNEPKDAAKTAERLLNAVAKPHYFERNEVFVTTSIGISMYPGDGQDAEALFKRADAAMYEAKKNGRQSYQFFRLTADAHAEGRFSIEQGLRRALEREEFTLQYQPKIDLKSGAITGVEALLRWTHPTLGLVPPEQFIPVAEESGLILPIGAWVLQEACTQARSWANDGLSTGTMAINVSAVQFRTQNFLNGLLADLNKIGLPPQNLELEMTESVLMNNPELTGPILRTLRDNGVQVSVDDFGTGYSSLSYLQQFPLDALKIDRSFVQRIQNSPDDAKIVSAIISMGRDLKLRVIAEGVETLADVKFLKTRDCDEAQGYYFSRPLSAEHLASMLQRQRSRIAERAFAKADQQA